MAAGIEIDHIPGSSRKAAFRRLTAIMRKEFLHIQRDPRTLLIIFILPIVMMLLFGYAVRLDVKNISLAVADRDNSAESRQLIRAFEQSGYYHITRVEHGDWDAHDIFLSGEAVAVLSVPVDYGRSLSEASPRPVQFMTDAAESNTATIAAQYAQQIVLQHTLATWDSMGLGHGRSGVGIRSVILFNPELESTFNIVPGLVAVLFMMACALLTSVTIVREKETGTLEQILVSPVNVGEIIIGKVLPYVILSSLLGILVVVFSMHHFHVPFEGRPVELALFSLVYLLCALSFGILISTKARTMQVALMIALISTMLPSVMLSGFIFPIASMPAPIQLITRLVPARYYLVIIRGIMLKGATMSDLQEPLIALGIFAFVVLTVSVKRFRASLE
ncbi:ABC transporter permease [bacterium]|nr:ABC transporter permease [candidate division CSSED10-310 bacterium]